VRPHQFRAKPLWWEIAYTGGRIIHGETRADWNGAPQDGVLVVRQPVDRTYVTPNGRVHFVIIVASVDYYWLDKGGTICGGSAKEIPVNLDERSVKRGAWAERREFTKAYNKARVDIVAAD
jgi:hypothetical protein